MSYHRTLERLTDDVQAKVLTVFEAWQAGRLTEDQFVQVAAVYVAQGNSRAVALADLAFAAALTVELGRPQASTGVTAADEQDRLREGLTTLAVAAASADVTARLVRFAKAEPSAAAQTSWSDALKHSDHVEGWTRQLDANACELCQSWATGDQVFPKDVQMIHHTGCQCTPKPVLRKDKK